jgi:hypothetical protein
MSSIMRPRKGLIASSVMGMLFPRNPLQRRALSCSNAVEDSMAKALEVNDNTAQNQKRQPQRLSGDKRNQQKLQGKALQVNENSVEDQEPVRSPAPPRRG